MGSQVENSLVAVFLKVSVAKNGVYYTKKTCEALWLYLQYQIFLFTYNNLIRANENRVKILRSKVESLSPLANTPTTVLPHYILCAV